MNQKDKKPETVYNERIEGFNGLLKQLKKKDKTLSIIKLVLFFAGFFFLFKFISTDPALAGTVFGILLTCFFTAVVFHETVLDTVKRYKTLKTIDETEIKMLRHEFPSKREGDMGGKEFKDPDHGYTSDLDIFGDKSVFHYINRTVTAMGRETLARWLRTPAAPDRIRDRQEAVGELAAKLDFRQNLQAHGMAMDDTAKKLESLYRLFDE